MVVVDPIPKSVALIETGLTADPPWLSRRRRHAALAVDVNGPLACTVFMHRYNSGEIERRVRVFTRCAGVWRSLGGEQRSTANDDGLSDRPPREALGGVLVEVASGAVQTTADRVFPWPRRYVHYALVRAARGAQTVTVDHRRLTVPRHGHLVVVWNGRRPPRVLAYDADGAAFGRLMLPPRSRQAPPKQLWREPGQPPWWW